MKYIVKKNHYNIPEEVLLEDLRQAARKLAKDTVSVNEYKLAGSYDPMNLIYRFGSWNAAIEKAGLKINRLNFIPSTELMHNLKCVWDSLGRQPTWEDMVKPLSKYNRATYYNRYGSWNNTIDAFDNYIKTGAYKNAVEAPEAYRLSKRTWKRKTIGKGMRFDIFKRDNFRCKCGRSPAKDPAVVLHIDHIIPVSKGGKTTMENLQTLCSECNSGKGTK